ncbi:MAG: transcriptional repressor LexA [Gammaproteobacteria bacterium]|nr:transcriptional repressor LexA [Gammaproteobacteria bacterium]
MDSLTHRQTEIYDFIRRHMAEHGRPPTRPEICLAFGFGSQNAADDHLKALARKGVIELIPGAARGIRLKQAGLAIIGRVAAGQPILAEENIEARVNVDMTLFKPAADYLLRVRGQSMRDAGILDGDLLAVYRTPEARNGQIVIARVDNDVTVKRFQRRGHLVQLLPENPEFQPIEVDLRRTPFAIEGIGVGLIRNGKLS